MTRGKHSTAADARHAREDAIQQAARLERELSHEKRRAGDALLELDKSRLEFIHATTRLSQQVAAGTSDKVVELDARVERARQTIRELEKLNGKVRKSHEKLFRQVCDHFRVQHGFTGADAVQKIADLLGFTGYIADDQLIKSGLAIDQAYLIDRARGIRTTPLTIADDDDAEPEAGRRGMGNYNTALKPW